MKQHIFHVSGTHCPSCKLLIEETLIEEDGVTKASVNLEQRTVLIECENDETSKDLMCTLSGKIESYGYRLIEREAQVNIKEQGLIWQAIPIGIIILILFLLLQKSGILNFAIGGGITPITSFFVGLVASVSSCLAVVG